MMNYYVSLNGSDSNDGASVQSPFRTIGQAASLVEPGDTVYIRGGTYRETITPANGGTADRPIKFRAYEGEDVLISGLDVLPTDWTRYSEEIYYTDCKMNLEDQNAVFVDGESMVYARWPNKTGSSPMTNDGAEVDDGTLTSITDADMPNPFPGFYDGAVVWCIAGAKWKAWGTTIESSGNGTIRFAIPGDMGDYHNPGDTTRGDRNYYYIAGKLELLDAEKEWFYDSNISRLYLYAPGGGNPAFRTVEIKARVLAIDLTGKSYIHIQGIHIKGASMIITGDHNLVDGMTASHLFSHNARGMYHTHPATANGIRITGSHNTVQNGDFGYSDGNIFLIDAGADNVITNNYIHDGDLNGCYDALIRLEDNSDDHGFTTITYNTLYNTGRSAVHFIRPARFEHNEVYGTNIVGDDGSAIYMGSDLLHSTVAYNIVHDIYWQSGSRAGVVSGIYMDGGAHNAIAHHNVVYNIGQDAAFRMNAPTEGGRHLYNNTTYNTPEPFVTTWGEPEFAEDNNLHNPDASNFVNVEERDFRLAPGSGAIDAGNVHSPWTDGFTGNAPDKGAYEYGGEPWKAGVQAIE
ncbi:DUF1565 domain-containing protein [Cohnella endophytica]|uniref:DUF1565 domain-containing protein n=1 Tax=Cohnella endophytica TaxID=2419778 RepID=A0A494XGT3_9BACL|nr:right-handed parallel beta-helix repeat-containing protein [Cohnella endophytica]RKP49870.1 DUF1565 domain-containing protein [Cohnella endophytica]